MSNAENMVVNKVSKLSYYGLDELVETQGDLKSMTKEAYHKFRAQILENGFTSPFHIWVDSLGIKRCLDGHQRLKTLKMMRDDRVGMPDQFPCVEILARDEQQAREILLALATQYGKMSDESLSDYMIDSGIEMDYLDNYIVLPDNIMLNSEPSEEMLNDGVEPKKLTDKFLVPPFTVLDTKQGYWKNRKAAWLALGIKSEEGRDVVCNAVASSFKGSPQATNETLNNSTSVFDPVLCEIAYSWFSPVNGVVLDPFAGGSCRGVVASAVNRKYIGVELRKEQVEANRIQGLELCAGYQYQPQWIEEDSMNIQTVCKDVQADFIFSCPPYADLEVYSDDPRDISSMEYKDFNTVYAEIIKRTCQLLKPNRFACFVVGEVRDSKGNYYNFVNDTIKAFRDAGLSYYNEAILLTSIGTVCMQASRNFPIGRKLGKVHQNVLVFLKGDSKLAVEACGPVEVDLSLLDQEQLEG